MTDGVTRAWVAQQRAAGACPVVEGWRDGVLTVWVPGRPRNPMNGSHEHWSKRAKWAKTWRETAAARIYQVVLRSKPSGLRVLDKKIITFTVYGPARFDDDNLRAVVKPVRDALKDMAVIDDDRDSAGHTFRYEQAKPSRKKGSVYGISLTIARREEGG